MVKNKLVSAKKPLRLGSKPDETVPVSTSLPPKINGQLRCYLKVKVSRIIWHVPKAPDVAHVRLLFWGEEGKGSFFRPEDGRPETKALSRTTARYGIRSGPRQFVEYLNDMGTLVFEVLGSEKMSLVGRAQINDIGSLTASKPLTGTFPVLSADSQKVADLKILISIDPIMNSYETSSSVPTPDHNSDFYAMADYDIPPINAPRVIPAPENYDSVAIVNTLLHSPAAQKLDSGRSTPSGVDAQLFGTSGNEITTNLRIASDVPSATLPRPAQYGSASPQSRSISGPRLSQTLSVGGTQAPRSPARQSGAKTHLPPAKREKFVLRGAKKSGPGVVEQRESLKNPEEQNADGTETKDLLTTLITKGSKLRNEMIISAIDPMIGSKDTDSFPKSFSAGPSFDVLQDSFDGLSNNILTSGLKLTDPEPSDVDNEVLDILFDHNDKLKGISDLLSSPVLSLSDDDRHIILSDSDNPIHDVDLLDDILYKNDSDDDSELLDVNDISPNGRRSRSHSAGSVESLNNPGNMRPPSRHSSASGSGRNTPVTPPKGQKSPKSTKRKSRKPVKGRLKKGSRIKELRHKPEESDSDATNVSLRSEGSRVSFDPTPSDSEVNSSISVKGRRRRTREVDGLSIQRYALLGRISKARVTLGTVVLRDDVDLSANDMSGKNKLKAGVRGKPPTPNTVRKSLMKSYFVEYQFPVAATSRDKNNPNAMATEVVKVESKKITGKVISFDCLSAFPVLFDADSLEKWWKSALVFKLYCRTGTQKVSNLLGMCSLPLKSVLKAKALFLGDTLEVKDRSQGSAQSADGQESEWRSVGQLKISVELATDTKELQAALAKAQLAELKGTKIIPVVKSPVKRRASVEGKNREAQKVSAPQGIVGHHSSSGTQTEAVATDIRDLPVNQLPMDFSRQNYPLQSVPMNAALQPSVDYANTIENVTLHALLIVSEGINVTLAAQPPPSSLGNRLMGQLSNMVAGDSAAHNIYIVSRMFFSDDACRSSICWGTSNPKFDFVQMSAFLLTQSLLERMRNNFMIIEVYVKKPSSHPDQLIGIVKLPLHMFYSSYRDRRISAALLAYPSPVVSVDGEMPITNLFTGSYHGNLKVLLVMGSLEQVTILQRNRVGSASSIPINRQPIQHLERIHLNALGALATQHRQTSNMVEHLFEVAIAGITGLKLPENMTFGEADCFIQYHFPAQTTANLLGTSVIQNGSSLKSFSTNTTLCGQDPLFHHLYRHKIILPEDSHVQKEILAVCSGVGGGAGGVLFELWFRCYSPNTREQIYAKALLPLAKLCAMVTMKRQNEPSIQSFSLALTKYGSDDEFHPVQEFSSNPSRLQQCGSLDVTVNYRTNVIKRSGLQDGLVPSVKSLSGGTVCISVNISKACGLKTAALALVKHNDMMKYPSEVGVNSYVRVRLSFLPAEDDRLTRTIARSFAPDFSCAMDFPCPLLWTEIGSDALSLAEILENAEIVFEVWHQTSGTKADHNTLSSSSGVLVGHHLVPPSNDILLGFARVPLKTLLFRRSGIFGWQSIHCANVGWETDASRNDRTSDALTSSVGDVKQVVGGLEVKVSFSREKDLDAVFDAAYGVGWSPSEDGEWKPSANDDDAESVERFNSVTIAVDDLSFPLVSALFAGQSKLVATAACYIKYRFYDTKAVISKMCPVEVKDGFVEVSIRHSKTHTVHGSSVFFSYLREEQLEIEVMVTCGLDDGERQCRSQDRKIGSAFIDLLSLHHARDRQQRIRSTIPLFKPGSSSLGGARLSAHVTIKPCSASSWEQSDEDDQDYLKFGRNRTSKSPTSRSKLKDGDFIVPDLEKVFPVHIGIERAFHLPMVMEDNVGMEPCAYVSYQTAEKLDLTYTKIIKDTINPVWCHEHDTYLNRDLLTHKDKHLIFKVWHKPKDVEQIPNKGVDRVLGFVSVDLSCLKSFGSVCGCYNVIDVKGICRGQLQVSIVPSQAVMSSNMDELELTQIPLPTSTVFVPGNTIWCSKTYGRTSSYPPQTLKSAENRDQVPKFHNSQIQHVIDSLRNVDVRILSLSKPQFESQDEATALESEAMPLSTSSLLMTYGSTTIGTNTWGAMQAAIEEEKAVSDIIDIEANDMRKFEAGDGLTSAESSTKDTMARFLQQTLEKTGSTVVSFAVGDNNKESDGMGRSGTTDHLDIGLDFSATLKNAQNLLQQFKPFFNQTNDGFDGAPLTIKANDQMNFYDKLKIEEQGRHLEPDSHDDSAQRLRTDDQYSNIVDVDGNLVDDNPISDFEEDTLSNIWAMRSSRRRSSEESFDSTVEQVVDSTYVEPRVLNDISSLYVKDLGSNEPVINKSTKPVSENIVRTVVKEIAEEEVSSDTMFMDSREFEITEVAVDIENMSDSQSRSTSKINDEPKSHSDHTSISQKSINTNNNSSKIHLVNSHDDHKTTDPEDRVQKRSRHWKEAMQRRELQHRESSASSESEEDLTSRRLAARPPSKNRATRNRSHHNTPSATSIVSRDGSKLLKNRNGCDFGIGYHARISATLNMEDRVRSKRTPQNQDDAVRVEPPEPNSTAANAGDGLEQLDKKLVKAKTLPNFFLPSSELAKSMHLIYGVKRTENGTSKPSLETDDEVEKEKAEAANEILQKFNSFKASSTKRIAAQAKDILPAAETLQRIAKIFDGKFKT